MKAADSAYYQEVAARYPGKYGIVGMSPKMMQVFRLIQAYNSETGSPIDIPVLITGPTGSGKNRIARAIHEESRRSGNFVSINCAALPYELLESEFFGYERGSFTGADRNKAGMFKVADGGTLHLDEIGLMHIKLQAKILAAVEDKEITRIGGTRPISVDVRIVASTNTDLEMAVSRGQFREDLYHRLNVLPIYVPGLDERKKEISLLAQFLYEVHILKLGKPFILADRSVFGVFADYRWPGNVRQLENVIERMVTLNADPSNGVEKFLDATQLSTHDKIKSHALNDAIYKEDEPAVTPIKVAVKTAVAEAEREAIRRVLDKVHWNKSAASGVLKISYKALLYKIKGYGLIPPNRAGADSAPRAPVVGNADVYIQNPPGAVQPTPISPQSPASVVSEAHQPLPLEEVIVLEEGKAEGEKPKDSPAELQGAKATRWKPTDFERFKMERVLREARGDVSYAAKLVGMTRDDFDTRWRVYTIKGNRK